MKVLQFAFDVDSESDYLPHNHLKNCVAYTGTHDNDTLIGWFKSVSKEEQDFVKSYLRLSEQEGYNWGMIKSVWASPAEIAIVPMQDFLGLGSEARINTPSTLGGNWAWRIRGECINDWLAEIIYHYTKTYRRVKD
jgi:4-alpha-glucanotransferase